MKQFIVGICIAVILGGILSSIIHDTQTLILCDTCGGILSVFIAEKICKE